MAFNPKRKKLGQVFLADANIAEKEAEYGRGRNVLEIGPGYGTLTERLCAVAESVLAVEKDERLYRYLRQRMHRRNLKLINMDFLKMDDDEIRRSRVNILISNIPYNISSRIVGWISSHDIPALICVQKEFAEHMSARSGTHDYSNLSVMCALKLHVVEMMDVSRYCFRPVPKVDSEIIYVKPLGIHMEREEEHIISLLMQHKKKTVRKAFVSIRKSIGMERESIDRMLSGNRYIERRVFKMEPEELLELARSVAGELRMDGLE
jgi:16S rRNA (adenine1518-N6/adenine1519-N6)-dimethyltransferase